MYHILLIHLWVDEHSDYFQYLALTNNDAMNINIITLAGDRHHLLTVELWLPNDVIIKKIQFKVMDETTISTQITKILFRLPSFKNINFTY